MSWNRLAILTAAFLVLTVGPAWAQEVDLPGKGGKKNEGKGGGKDGGGKSDSGGNSGSGSNSGQGGVTSGGGSNSGTGSTSGGTTTGTQQPEPATGGGGSSGGNVGGSTTPTGGHTSGSSSSSSGGKNGTKATSSSSTWVASFEQALQVALEGERCVLVYVFPKNQSKDAPEFGASDVVEASGTTFVFYKREYDPAAPEIQRFGVRRAPTLLGMDRYGNEFKRIERLTIADLRSLLKTIPDLVRKFVERMRSDLARAEEAERVQDRAKALKSYVSVAGLGRHGYSEIERALAWVTQEGTERLQRIESLPDERKIQDALVAFALEFKGTPPAVEAEVRLARKEVERGAIPAAIARLTKLADDSAKQELEAVIAAGLKKVDASKGLADVSAARQILRKIQEDYKGTEVAQRAAEALTALK